jgi:hypothetical protein
MSYSTSSNGKDGAGPDVAGLAQATKLHSRKAMDIAKEQVKAGAVIAREAAESGAYIWPIQVRLSSEESPYHLANCSSLWF